MAVDPKTKSIGIDYTLTSITIGPNNPDSIAIGGNHSYTTTGHWSHVSSADTSGIITGCTFAVYNSDGTTPTSSSIAYFTGNTLYVVDNVADVGASLKIKASIVSAGITYTSVVDVITILAKPLVLDAISDSTIATYNLAPAVLNLPLSVGSTGTPPYTYALTNTLFPGTLSPFTVGFTCGTSGSPTAVLTFPIPSVFAASNGTIACTVRVTDNVGQTQSRTFNVGINSTVAMLSALTISVVNDSGTIIATPVINGPAQTIKLKAVASWATDSYGTMPSTDVTSSCTFTSNNTGVVISGTNPNWIVSTLSPTDTNPTIISTSYNNFRSVQDFKAGSLSFTTVAYIASGLNITGVMFGTSTPAISGYVRALGDHLQLKAEVSWVSAGVTSKYDVTSSCVWTSNNTAIARVGTQYPSNAPGEVNIIGYHSASIGASYSVSGVTLNSNAPFVTYVPTTLLSIAITDPGAITAYLGTDQLGVTGTYSDGSTGIVTNQCSFVSDTPSVATVTTGLGSGNGLVTGVAISKPTVNPVVTATVTSDPPYINSQFPASGGLSAGIAPGPKRASVDAGGPNLQYQWYQDFGYTNNTSGVGVIALVDGEFYAGSQTPSFALSSQDSTTPGNMVLFCDVWNTSGIHVKTGTARIYLIAQIVRGCPATYMLIDTTTGPKRADELQVGDMLPTFNSETLDYGSFPVMSLNTGIGELWRIVLEDARVLDFSKEHPFYSFQRGWVKLWELQVGETLFGANPGKIKELYKLEDEAEIIGISVAEALTMQSNGILAHNQGTDWTPTTIASPLPPAP